MRLPDHNAGDGPHRPAPGFFSPPLRVTVANAYLFEEITPFDPVMSPAMEPIDKLYFPYTIRATPRNTRQYLAQRNRRAFP